MVSAINHRVKRTTRFDVSSASSANLTSSAAKEGATRAAFLFSAPRSALLLTAARSSAVDRFVSTLNRSAPNKSAITIVLCLFLTGAARASAGLESVTNGLEAPARSVYAVKQCSFHGSSHSSFETKELRFFECVDIVDASPNEEAFG